MEATNQESYERDYTEFLEELEEDKLFRQNVNIYFSESVLSLSLPPPCAWCMTAIAYLVDPKAQAPPIQDPDAAVDVPRIGIEEMLQDLSITDDSRTHDHESS